MSDLYMLAAMRYTVSIRMRAFLQWAMLLVVFAGLIIGSASLLMNNAAAAEKKLEEYCQLPALPQTLKHPTSRRCPINPLKRRRCMDEVLATLPGSQSTDGYRGVKAGQGSKTVESLKDVVLELHRRAKAYDTKIADPNERVGPWMITEADPPKETHKSPCHRADMGCAIDLALLRYTAVDSQTGKKVWIEPYKEGRVTAMWRVIADLFKDKEICIAINEALDLEPKVEKGQQPKAKLCPEFTGKRREEIQGAGSHFHIERWGKGKEKCWQR